MGQQMENVTIPVGDIPAREMVWWWCCCFSNLSLCFFHWRGELDGRIKVYTRSSWLRIWKQRQQL